jgi:hypothetical protein
MRQKQDIVDHLSLSCIDRPGFGALGNDPAYFFGCHLADRCVDTLRGRPNLPVFWAPEGAEKPQAAARSETTAKTPLRLWRRDVSAPVYIARLAGPILVVIGVGVLLNLQHYVALTEEAVRSPTLIYIAGLLALTGGLAMVNAYRAWTGDWRVVVTVLGWLMVIGGFMRIVLPRLTAGLATAIYSGSLAMTIAGVIILVVGGYLSFEGYRRKQNTGE